MLYILKPFSPAAIGNSALKQDTTRFQVRQSWPDKSVTLLIQLTFVGPCKGHDPLQRDMIHTEVLHD